MIRAAKMNTFLGFHPWGCPGVEQELGKLWLTVWPCTSFQPKREGGSWRDNGSSGPSPDLWHRHCKQDLTSHNLAWGAPPAPGSRGRGAALGVLGAHAPVTVSLEQPWPGRAPGPICFLPAWPPGRWPAPACLSPWPVCHPDSGAPHTCQAGSGHACSQAHWAVAEGAGTWAGADPAAGHGHDLLLRKHLLQDPPALSEQAKILFLVLTTAPTERIFQLVQSIF